MAALSTYLDIVRKIIVIKKDFSFIESLSQILFTLFELLMYQRYIIIFITKLSNAKLRLVVLY